MFLLYNTLLAFSSVHFIFIFGLCRLRRHGANLLDAGIPAIGLEGGETAVLAVVPGTLPSLALSAILVWADGFAADGAESFVTSDEGLRGNS